MSLPWFRLYHRMVDDEKLRLLAFEDRWHFVALCCLKADGLLDTEMGSLRDRKISVRLGVQVRELEEIGRRLREVELVDDNLHPFAWDELQFKSDTSKERVRRYRQSRKDAGLPAQWQPTKLLKKAVFEKGNFVCGYCNSSNDLTIDHITPPMRGGSNEIDNLQLLCRSCNAKKRDLTDDEYRKRYGNVTVTSQDKDKDKDKDKDIITNVIKARDRAVLASRPNGVSESLWRDWISHRKAKFTETALAGFQREASKAGWSIDAAIREAIERGWQGFKAEWVVGKSSAANPYSGPC